MRGRYLTILLVLLVALNGCMVTDEVPVQNFDCAENVENPNTHVAGAALDSVIDKAVAEGLVGGTALLISEQKGTYLRPFGSSNLAAATNTLPCQKYRVASLTKMFTAVATLLLVQDGVISLETKAGIYLDSSKVIGIRDIEKISIEQLLNHTSGIPNYDDDVRFAPMILNNPGRDITLEEKLNLVRNSGGRVPDWVIRKFGQIYSNTNYLILQLIIEKASGKDYEEFVMERIIQPLGLVNTSFASIEAYPQELATGYVDFYGNDVMRNVNSWDAHRFDAEGDLISTARDLGTFFQALLSGRILSANLLDQMKQRRLGLLQEEFELENALGHDGIAIGYSAEMWYLPQSKLMVVLLSNQGRLINENWSVLRFENLLRELILYGK